MLGETIGAYRVEAKIGEGGMGQVFRAVDTRLDREVAVKVLCDAFVDDPDRLARFDREARLLASLNHPRIAQIYGFEAVTGADGRTRHLLVMELARGEDLSARIARGPIPVDEAVSLAVEIAEALEAAHARGVVHRDLKPANITVTHDGHVKVLDFGLAKAWTGGTTDARAALTQSPTMTEPGTMAGLILGTAAYMSPEQATGRPVDRRTDIWSFGVVLFEMLTARRPFAAATVAEMIAAVLKEEPDWSLLPAETPPSVMRVLRRCLRKRATERLQDIGDARLDLTDPGEPPRLLGAASQPATVPARRPWWARPWLWGVAGVAIGLGGAALTRTPVDRPPMHFVLHRPPGVSMVEYAMPAVSPDGRRAVFAGARPGEPAQLFVSSFDGLLAQPIPDTAGAANPFWAPDGRTIGFFTEAALRQVRLDGAPSQTIVATGRVGYFGRWLRSGTIVFVLDGPGAILQVPAAGGAIEPFTHLDAARGDVTHDFPSVSPDERYLLYYINSTDPARAGLHRAPLDAPDDVALVTREFTRGLDAEGRLLYVQEHTLLARPFDLAGAVFTGPAVPLVDGVAEYAPAGDVWSLGVFDLAPGGILIYPQARDTRSQLAWTDRTGRHLSTVGEPAAYGQIALAPDGRRLAAEVAGADGRSDLWLVDMPRGVGSRLTFDPGNEWDPVWSPDGRALVFTSEEDGTKSIRHFRIGDPAGPTPFLQRPADAVPESWSPDGRVVFVEGDLTARSIRAAPVAGGPAVEIVPHAPHLLDEGQVSPDGRWLAYLSDESGRYEVYVQPFDREGERIRVSRDGGGQPKWRADGRELFYATSDGTLMAATFEDGTRPEIGRVSTLFRAGLVRADFDDYAVSADGQRFLLKVRVDDGTEDVFHFVLNWPSLLP